MSGELVLGARLDGAWSRDERRGLWICLSFLSLTIFVQFSSLGLFLYNSHDQLSSMQVRSFLSDQFGVQVSIEQVAALTSVAAAPARRLDSFSTRDVSALRAKQRIHNENENVNAHHNTGGHTFADPDFVVNMIDWRSHHPLHESPLLAVSHGRQLHRRRAEELLTREQEDEMTDWRLALIGKSDADQAGEVDTQSELNAGDESVSVDTAPDASEARLLSGNAGRGANEEIGMEVEPEAGGSEAAEAQATVSSVQLSLTVNQLQQLQAAIASQNNDGNVKLGSSDNGVVGTCGNGVCEYGEAGAGCASDCKLPSLQLPCPDKCNGHGDCDGNSGTCRCFYGYLDVDCSACALGFVRVDAACVRYFPADPKAIQETTAAPSLAPGTSSSGLRLRAPNAAIEV